MNEINWISPTAANWSTPAAWQGGIVPGINDAAVFTNTGTGNCTLDVPVTCGFKVTPDYAGVFAQNGKKITVPENGVLHLIKSSSNAISLNGEIEMHGSEFMGYGVAVNQATIRLLSTACDWWFHNTTGTQNEWYSQSLANNAAITLKKGTISQYALSFTSNFILTGRRQNWAGTIDFGTTSGVTNFLPNNPNVDGTANVVFTASCRIISTNLNSWYTPGTSPLLHIAAAAAISKNCRFMAQYNSSLGLIPDDYRNRTIYLGITSSLSSEAIVISLLEGEYQFDAILMRHGRILASAGTSILWHGDLVPVINTNAGQSVFLPDEIILNGTADQEIDTSLIFNESPLQVSAQKTAGDVTTTAGTRLNVIADSTCPQIINAGEIDIADGVTLEADKYIAAPTSTLSGAGTLKTQSIIQRTI